MKIRVFFQVLLAAALAFGLICSPLQSTPVVQSARLSDGTAVPAEEPVVGGESPDQPVTNPPDQTSPDESQPPEAAPPDNQVVTDVPVESASTPEPVVIDPAVVETPVPESIDPQPSGEPVVLVESTQSPADQSAQLPENQPATQSVEIIPTARPVDVQTTQIAAVGSDSDSEVEQVVVEPQWMSGKILIQFDSSTNLEKLTTRLNELGYSISEPGTVSGVIMVDVPLGQEVESAGALKSVIGVDYAEPVYLATALDMIPNDPGFPSQPNMLTIDAPGGWQYFTGSTGVIVAIIDTGINFSNSDFAGRIVQGYDFVNGDDVAMDDNGHGTHIAGIVAATGNNGAGVAGLDWSAKIMPIKVLNSAGNGTELNVYQGIMYAVDHGAQIINLSLGMVGNSALVASAVEYAYQHGVTVVAASGNTGTAVNFPASLPHVIAVGAVDDNENQLAFSNYGNELDLVAPGKDVLSTGINGPVYRTGTSMAAAHVSGLASLLKGISPISSDVIKYTMESSAKDLGATGWDSIFGSGLIRVKNAILQLLAALSPSHVEEKTDEESTPIPYPTYMPTPTPTPAAIPS
jgi:subtilisin family serine protease